MEFTWEESKARANARKHGITFDEAMGCFYDQNQVAFYDPEHSDDEGEDREIMIAHSLKGHLLMVAYTLRGDTIRIISARRATRNESKDYAKGI